VICSSSAGERLESSRLKSRGFAGQIFNTLRQSQLFDLILKCVVTSRRRSSIEHSAAPSRRRMAATLDSGNRRVLFSSEDDEVNQMRARGAASTAAVTVLRVHARRQPQGDR
jgi:hypothetical protein